MQDYIEQFRNEMRAGGVEPPTTILPDGEIHRFSTNDRLDDDAGWYVLHVDGLPAGCFGDWRTGVSKIWNGDVGRALTPHETEDLRARAEAMRRQRQAEDTLRHSQAQERARSIWNDAVPASDDHAYLIAKGVRSRGLRVCHGNLLVPVLFNGELQSLQIIGPGGDKRFLTGGRVAGGYFDLGTIADSGTSGILCVAEGYATAETIFEATGHPVRAAFYASNLLPATLALHTRMSNLRFVFCADDDIATKGNPGLTKAKEAARAVNGTVAIPDFGPTRPAGVTDFNDLANFHGLDAVRAVISKAIEPRASVRLSSVPAHPSVDAQAAGEPAWPVLDLVSLYGPAGDLVRAIEPHTEADPVALLLQFLAAIGSVYGRSAYYQVEADRHYANLYVVLVGTTSKARKGTAKGQIMSVVRSVDGTWEAERVQSGLSSGEGLIWAVRDPIEHQEPIKDKRQIIGYETVVDDPGVEDKRLLVIEPEFASTLRVLGREGNTLSAVLRNGWDSGRLRTLTKNSPAHATGAHISIVGHITQDELRRYLDSTEAGNGFANRFLWNCVHRSKCLPEGGQLADVDFQNLIQVLNKSIEFARTTERVEFNGGAREIWYRVYPSLSEGQSGLFGAVTSRAEAQVVRLALIYALLECSAQIRETHLMAALAVWEYAEDSARYIFGEALGDPMADDIFGALRRSPDGLTRTQINDLFGRNRSAGQLGRALSVLMREGKVTCEKVVTDGRSAEVWHAITGKAQP